ncbi:transglutaminase-like domain-containing protein [Jannaschia aquimarina]|uniref:Transglutaminase-like superfamily protein n=1 Tax=Jannaschia aquimarina TaxID=935700 RepID=A0A0D1EJL8_9RHOB|nr:transglutaminase family protein [Jannaschia aquimarina]KIT17774.1 Transglutaminase-like superfamily protein [Jannaschia aquimarina]SNS95718.1 Transglutaminase-like superfamily protein [Jannaschia aquimarina]
MERLADFETDIVATKAASLTADATTTRDKLDRLFRYVRDDIVFGFPPEGDFVKASDTIRFGYGQCNTKATLLLALCKACRIPARIHFSLIRKDIQKGFFTGLAYWLVPDEISHSWIEVEIDGRWRKIDTFINDLPLFNAAKEALHERGWSTGYSLALTDGEASPDLDLDHEAFQQMAAVTGDHGTWDDPADYYASAKYRNRPGRVKLWAYRLMIGRINRRVRDLRAGAVI